MSDTPDMSFNDVFTAVNPWTWGVAAVDSATGNNAGAVADFVRDPSSVMPQAPKLPDLPMPDEAETNRRMDEAALAERKRAGAGRASTVLTGGTGLLGTPSLSRRVLLGS